MELNAEIITKLVNAHGELHLTKLQTDILMRWIDNTEKLLFRYENILYEYGKLSEEVNRLANQISLSQ